MGIEVFLGIPPPNVQEWIEKTYLTIYKVQITLGTGYPRTGIYSAERDDISKPIVINWGDGTYHTVTIHCMDGEVVIDPTPSGSSS